MNTHEIRADYNDISIIVYQAYAETIGLPAVQNNRFVPPFSMNRMTWIKPSFLWMMERSNWGLKAGQEMVLAVRITREGWEEALSQAALTTYDDHTYRNYNEWSERLAKAAVRVQWDPERTLRGKSMDIRSIQVGLSRSIVERYVQDWTIEIKDMTPMVRKIHRLLQQGQENKAKELLPKERVYPLTEILARQIGSR